MGRVEAKKVEVIKHTLYCNSCYHQEMAICPKEQYSSNFRYICPKCKNSDYQQGQYPLFESLEDSRGLESKIIEIFPKLMDDHSLPSLEAKIIEIFSKLIPFSDLPRYANSENYIIQQAVKNRLQSGK